MFLLSHESSNAVHSHLSQVCSQHPQRKNEGEKTGLTIPPYESNFKKSLIVLVFVQLSLSNAIAIKCTYTLATVERDGMYTSALQEIERTEEGRKRK